MNFEATFPLRYWINLGRRADRRGEVEWMVERAGVTAERFPAVDARFVPRMALERRKAAGAEGGSELGKPLLAADETGKMPALLEKAVRGYANAGRYALALTQRMAIRQARLRGADAVLIFEDDVVLHPNFLALIEALELPDDWGIVYLGCAHHRPPTPAAPGIVRVTEAVDTHAFAVREPYYARIIAALNAHGKPQPGHPLASDRFLSALHRAIPTYACFPNLAWQANQESDLTHTRYTNYHRGGTQKQLREQLDRVFVEMFGNGGGLQGEEAGASKLGLLFLTRGDVNHPRVWREFIAGAPGRVKVYSHPKVADFQPGGFLAGTAIDERHATAWGAISLVRASLALLRAALEDESLTHFVLLSESCVPIRPLPAILSRLDWNPKSRFTWRTLADASPLQKSRASALPQVPPDCWRFQSQWWLLDRIAAGWVARADYTEVFAGMPIPDEAYFATALCMLGFPLDDYVTKKAVTWTHWGSNGGHPTEFTALDRHHLEDMLESGAWFARKFPAGADVGRYRLHQHRGCEVEVSGGRLGDGSKQCAGNAPDDE